MLAYQTVHSIAPLLSKEPVMRKSLPIVILSVLLTAIACLTFAGRPQAAEDAKTAKRVQKWEYRSGALEGIDDLNKVGEDGWEVCAMSFDDKGDPSQAWLKRPKND